jgi:methylase of polypeptide subunit release factors
LIPRSETAHITSLLARRISQSCRSSSQPLDIVDLCSGSGCISLLLAHLLRSSARLTGIDISPDAIALAKENAVSTGLQVSYEQGDLWEDGFLPRKVDILVSNPPYIPRREWDSLYESVKTYEDPLALIGDPQDVPGTRPPSSGDIYSNDGKGLAFYRRIAQLLPGVLTSDDDVQKKGWAQLPRVAVEIGYGQAKDVQEILTSQSGGLIRRVEVWDDEYGVERMVVGWTK